MPTPKPSLAEDKPFRLSFDAPTPSLRANPPYANDDTCDWGSDPMEILMAKQEREREELEEFMSSPRH